MKFTTLMSGLAFVALTAACSNTADGVKKDAEIAADKTSDAAAATTASVDAALETGQVKTALIADSRVDASDINVDTNNDTKTLTLKGSVPFDSMRTIAGEIAASKAVSYKIVNELIVKKKP